MAERDYALEMWRLLDPEANLISSHNLAERVVCVKSGKFSRNWRFFFFCYLSLLSCLNMFCYIDIVTKHRVATLKH
jgi:hypothetical protein